MPLQCSPCCTCPAPQFSYVSRAASKSMGGACSYRAFDGSAQYFLTLTDDDDANICDGGTTCRSVTQVRHIDPLTCAESCVSGCDCDPDNIPGPGTCVTTTTATSTSTTCTATTPYCKCRDCGSFGTATVGTTTLTLSDEYTTAALKTNTVDSLPAWGPLPAFGGGYPAELASTELSSDGTGYSIMESKYQLAHPIPPGGTYTLAWIERFTPDDGSGYVDTAKTYTWTGARPSGYNPDDSATWPKTGVFEVDHPADNGVVSFHELSVDCGSGPTTLLS